MNELDNVVVKILTTHTDRFMFFGLFMSEVNRRFDKDMPTAGIWRANKHSPIEILFGEQFWKEHCDTSGKKCFLMLHEISHYVYGHLTNEYKSLMPDKIIANIAEDIFINYNLENTNKIVDKSKWIEIPGDRKDIALLENYKELKLKPDESSFYYYKELMKAKEKKQKSKEKGEDSLSGMKGEGTSGCEKLDKDIDGGVDWHESWESVMEGMSDAEKEVFQKQIESAVKRVAEETVRQRGTLPANIEGLIQTFEKEPPVVPWERVFKNFVGSCISTDSYNTRKRPNMRFDEAPATKLKTKIRIITLIDSSGSVSNDELDSFFCQIHHMYKAGVEIDVAMWDAAVDKEYRYKGEHTYERTKCGGTNMSCAFNFASENRNKYSLAVVLSDGYVEDTPSICTLPTLIVITKNGNDKINTPHKIVKIN